MSAYRAQGGEVTDEVKMRISEAAPRHAPAQAQKPRTLLVFTLCRGFPHDSIPTGAAAMKILGERRRVYGGRERDIDMFTPEKLAALTRFV
jgi:hypothetical protein